MNLFPLASKSNEPAVMYLGPSLLTEQSKVSDLGQAFGISSIYSSVCIYHDYGQTP